MADPFEYKGCTVEVTSYQHTWGSYKDQWSGNTHIWYEGEQTPFSATVDRSFDTSTEAEANAARVARIWIDENPTRNS